MRYDTKKLDELYNQWLEQFSSTPSDELLIELIQTMRSKLTLLLGTSQILTDDLSTISVQHDDIDYLITTIVQSARQISVLLDAAYDVNLGLDIGGRKQPPA